MYWLDPWLTDFLWAKPLSWINACSSSFLRLFTSPTEDLTNAHLTLARWSSSKNILFLFIFGVSVLFDWKFRFFYLVAQLKSTKSKHILANDVRNRIMFNFIFSTWFLTHLLCCFVDWIRIKTAKESKIVIFFHLFDGLTRLKRHCKLKIKQNEMR